MTFNPNRRVSPPVLEADEDALIAVQNMKGYNPANPLYSVSAVTATFSALEAARIAELNAQNALNAARSATIAAEWVFHDSILGVKDQVIAQFGPSSDQVQSVGLKKKNDRRRPVRPPEPQPDLVEN